MQFVAMLSVKLFFNVNSIYCLVCKYEFLFVMFKKGLHRMSNNMFIDNQHFPFLLFKPSMSELHLFYSLNFNFY